MTSAAGASASRSVLEGLSDDLRVVAREAELSDLCFNQKTGVVRSVRKMAFQATSLSRHVNIDLRCHVVALATQVGGVRNGCKLMVVPDLFMAEGALLPNGVGSRKLTDLRVAGGS